MEIEALKKEVDDVRAELDLERKKNRELEEMCRECLQKNGELREEASNRVKDAERSKNRQKS